MWRPTMLVATASFDLMMEENFGRFLGKMSYESHENGPFYYFPILLSGLLPWSLLIVGSLFAVRWREVGMPKFRAVWSRFRSMDSVMQFAVVASVLIFVFYEIPKSRMPEIDQNELIAHVEWTKTSYDENQSRVSQLFASIDNQVQEHTAYVGQQQFPVETGDRENVGF